MHCGRINRTVCAIIFFHKYKDKKKNQISVLQSKVFFEPDRIINSPTQLLLILKDVFRLVFIILYVLSAINNRT